MSAVYVGRRQGVGGWDTRDDDARLDGLFVIDVVLIFGRGLEPVVVVGRVRDFVCVVVGVEEE